MSMSKNDHLSDMTSNLGRVYWESDLLITFVARVRKEITPCLKKYKNFAYAVETREKIVNHSVLSYIKNNLDKRDVAPECRMRCR